MTVQTQSSHIEFDAPIRTWFGVGGRADRYARPNSVEDLRRCLEVDADLRVLGDGANLLVDDHGVAELVVDLDSGEFAGWTVDPDSGLVVAGAGVRLPRLIIDTVRMGLGGLEVLAGIPASVGGAAVMNAGGAFGKISDVISSVTAVDRDGHEVVLDRKEIDFSYRSSGLRNMIITGVEFSLFPADRLMLRNRLKECMEYKKRTQPLRDNSAGCVFKNPVLDRDLDGIGAEGERVSAGMLLDRAGCKGLEYGCARISDQHGNFFVTEDGARARDVIELIHLAEQRVVDTYGVHLQREVVIWTRS